MNERTEILNDGKCTPLSLEVEESSARAIQADASNTRAFPPQRGSNNSAIENVLNATVYR